MSRHVVDAALRGHDEGAIAVMAGILFSTMVFFIMLAFAVDWGLVNWERSQVQRSADAASFSLAWKCAQKQPACASLSSATAFAGSVAASNAEDGLMAVTNICGRGTGGEPAQAWLTARPCASPPGGSDAYVQVAATSQTNGGNFITLPFTGVISQEAGGDQAVLSAAATASWTTAARTAALVIRPTRVSGTSNTITYRASNSNGDGYSIVTAPDVSSCFFTTAPPVGSSLTLSSSSATSTAVTTCRNAFDTEPTPFVVAVASANNRRTVSELRLVTNLSRSGTSIVVTWGGPASTAPVTVTMQP
ncbi:MAG: pilus assembly protein TadG-related protein [Actinomycetota bacterium]|nr:pilus assembly protein TadG-related protein [Actinomycetota bacterium]